MNHSLKRVPSVLCVVFVLSVSLAGGALGWFAAPALSRGHYIVQTAERVWHEESNGIEERTLQSAAWRSTAMPLESLFLQARETQNRFRAGAILLGAFLGMIAALKIVGLAAERAPLDHEAYPAHCIACGRCFRSCPRETLRLKRRAP